MHISKLARVAEQSSLHIGRINIQKAFTLVELLIVIAVIAILASVAFVALDPLTRFQDARDSTRVTDITAVLSAIKVHQIDNGGAYLSVVASATSAEVFMIGTATTGCNANNASCGTNVTSGGNCVDLAGLVTDGYLASIPVSPTGAVTWTDSTTGYTLQRDATGILHVRACEGENTTDEISVSR